MQFELPFFENICPSWNKVSHLASRRTFARGSQIFDLQTPVNGVYLVREGIVEIILYTQSGPEKVLFYVGRNCIFGEVSCFATGDSGEASARARSDCVLEFFSREVIEGVIARDYPQLLIELIRADAYKIRMYGVLLRDTLISNSFVRVCKMLVYLVNFQESEITRVYKKHRDHKYVHIQPELSQADLARLLGVHRVTVTKAIRRLKEMGILRRFTRHSLEILDYPALCALVDGEISSKAIYNL